MRERLTRYIKRLPVFYNFLHCIYWKIASWSANILGTKFGERRWFRRPEEKVKEAFTNLSHPHRNFLVEQIIALNPISSVLEFGCGYGANLYLLSRKLPQAQLTGIDINPLSVSEGNNWLAQQGALNVELITGKSDTLGKFSDKSYDIVLTDAVLIYIGPDKIKKVISEFLRIASKAVIFLELNSESTSDDPYSLGKFRFGNWERNYVDENKNFLI